MGTDADEGEWLTYDQIAQARGTAKIGAVRWVQRHRLRRQPGNDGMVRILVPPNVLRTGPPRRSSTVAAIVTPTVSADVTQTVTPDSAPLVEAANRRADEANRRADAALALANRAEVRADRAEQAAREAREAAETLRERMEALEAERETAVAQAEAARGRAEAATRLAEAAQEKVGLAEAAFTSEHDARVAAEALATAEHDRAEAARQRADEAEDYSTRLVGELDEFRAKAEVAEDAADALRQAEAERKARGRWARLRAAWRRE